MPRRLAIPECRSTELSPDLLKRLVIIQPSEITGHAVYKRIAASLFSFGIGFLIRRWLGVDI